MFNNPFKRRKKAEQLHFALVIADVPLEDAKFSVDTDCKFFVTTGEVLPRVVIPATVMKEIVDRFSKAPAPEGEIKISEKMV